MSKFKDFQSKREAERSLVSIYKEGKGLQIKYKSMWTKNQCNIGVMNKE